MHRGEYVPLTEPARRALRDMALREYRRPRDQARLLLEDALRRAGALPEEETNLTEAAREAVPA
jgi:hypothetical protein